MNAITPITAESWRAVVGWDTYEVSNQGRVRRASPARGATVGSVLNPTIRGKYGYLRVVLRQGGRARQVDVQILVAEAWIGPRPSPKHEAAHGDGNPARNSAENIRWATKRENEADKELHGTRRFGSTHPRAKLSEEAVCEIRRHPRSARVAQELAVKFGVAPSTIRNIRWGRHWSHVSGEAK